MNCGVNIDLKEIAQAIIDEYGEAILKELLGYIDLDGFVKSEKGRADNLTLGGSVTLTCEARDSLCCALSECIEAKIAEVIGCIKDNHATGFEIDKANSRITLTLKDGTKFHITKGDLIKFLGITTATDKDTKTKTFTLDETSKVITLEETDGVRFKIDLSPLFSTTGSTPPTPFPVPPAGSDTFINGFVADTVNDKLIIYRNDGLDFSVTKDELIQLLGILPHTDTDTTNVAFNLVGDVLSLTDSSGNSVQVDLSSLRATGGGGAPAPVPTTDNDTKTKTFTLDTATKVITLEESDGSTFTVDLKPVLSSGGGGTPTPPVAGDKYLISGQYTDIGLELLVGTDTVVIPYRPCTQKITEMTSSGVLPLTHDIVLLSGTGTYQIHAGMKVGQQITVVHNHAAGGDIRLRNSANGTDGIIPPFGGGLQLAGYNAAVTITCTALGQFRLWGDTK